MPYYGQMHGIRNEASARLQKRGFKTIKRPGVGFIGQGSGLLVYPNPYVEVRSLIGFCADIRGPFLALEPPDANCYIDKHIIFVYRIDRKKFDLLDYTVTVDHLCDQIFRLCLKEPKLNKTRHRQYELI